MVKSGYYVGEPKSGMTTQCLETVIECMDEHIPVLYISTEMNMQTTALRLVKLLTGIDISKHEGTKDLSKEEEKSVLAAIRKIKLGELYFHSCYEKFNINEIEKICKKSIMENHVKHIVIDRIPAVDFFVAKTRLKNNVMVPCQVGFTLAKQGVRGSGLTFHENI